MQSFLFLRKGVPYLGTIYGPVNDICFLWEENSMVLCWHQSNSGPGRCSPQFCQDRNWPTLGDEGEMIFCWNLNDFSKKNERLREGSIPGKKIVYVEASSKQDPGNWKSHMPGVQTVRRRDGLVRWEMEARVRTAQPCRQGCQFRIQAGSEIKKVITRTKCMYMILYCS